MSTAGGSGFVAVVALLATAVFGAKAAELPTIPVCSAAGASSSGSCVVMPAAAGTHQRVQLTLTAKRAVVPIGPYAVDTDALNGTYLPPLLQLAPGEDFEFRLQNELEDPPVPLQMIEATLDPSNPNDHSHDHAMPLPRSDLNLHTHGLIVSPKNARQSGRGTLTSGNGDNIFVAVPPGRSFGYDIDLPSSMAFSDTERVDHPEGLFWYHPHIHGLAQRQIAAGIAGPIAIGSPVNYLRRMTDVGLAYKHEDLIHKIEPRVIVLKDIIVSADKDPGELKGQPRANATWIGLKAASGAAAYPAEWSAGFLPTTCNEAPSGWCVPASTGDKAISRPEGFARKLIWMFTANGELDPSIAIGKGHYALLRFVNESPSLTYDLRFGTYPAGGLPFYVMGLDGALPGDVPTRTATLKTKELMASMRQPAVRLAQRTSLLLLPASRAEILIGGSQAPSTVTVSTKHFSTGAEPDLADEWPSALLGELSFAGENTLPGDLAFEPQLRIPTELAKAAPVTHLPDGCTQATLENTVTRRQWRRIVLDSNDTLFFVGSSVVTKDGVGPETESEVIAPKTMPMMGDEDAWKTTKHICVKRGETELWEIVNRTSEIHNFHMHQSKFKVAGLTDPNDKLANYPIFNQGEAVDTNVWHDTFPVPPALTKNGNPDPTQPGRIFVAINFGAGEQVGRFVFHCHILEHEDKGMMAPIEVLAADQ